MRNSADTGNTVATDRQYCDIFRRSFFRGSTYGSARRRSVSLIILFGNAMFAVLRSRGRLLLDAAPILEQQG